MKRRKRRKSRRMRWQRKRRRKRREREPSARNIQTYNAPGLRRYIGINLWGVGRAAPTGYIRSDRVEYLALLCPVHISALPPLCLFHPSSRVSRHPPHHPLLFAPLDTAVAPFRAAPFDCDCVPRVFVSARSCATRDTYRRRTVCRALLFSEANNHRPQYGLFIYLLRFAEF